jgi:hypothetical protein
MTENKKKMLWKEKNNINAHQKNPIDHHALLPTGDYDED